MVAGVYFKSKAEAEKSRKVYDRGLARAMWRKECWTSRSDCPYFYLGCAHESSRACF